MSDNREDTIRRRAYEIWEHEGRPEGEHDRHWWAAAAEVGEDVAPDAGASVLDGGAGSASMAETVDLATRRRTQSPKTRIVKARALSGLTGSGR